jgi:hypothetical protein
MTKATVLTPTYNHAAFIGPCIRSVLDQTLQDWEMVVVDDGSDDGTADIAESFGDPRIIVLRRRHEGVVGLGRAYALAMARATSPFVAILEGDDTWPPTKLEEQLTLFEDPAVVLAYGAAGLMDEKGCIYARFSHAPRGPVARNDPVGTIVPSLIRLNFIVAVTVMVRRQALDQIGGFLQPSGIPYVDHPTWLRLATVGKFARSQHIVGHWRRYAEQVTTSTWFDTTPDRTTYMLTVVADAPIALTPATRAALAASIRRDPSRQREEAAIAHGRFALVGGRWGQAARVFTQLLRTGEMRTRAVALLGLLSAAGRTDMEWLIRAMGRHSLPSRRHLASHGPFTPLLR